MAPKVISKVLEINNCPSEILLQVIYTSKFWEMISPVTNIEVNFTSPNVFYSKIVDEIKITGNFIKIPINMEGEMVLIDKGEESGKGHLIEFNVRENKEVRDLEGNIRIKAINPTKTKVGIFIHNFVLSSDFLNLIGKGAGELILRDKITKALRNIEKHCKTQKLEDLT